MKKCVVLLGLFLTVTLLAGELCARKPRRRPRRNVVESKNVYELFGTLKDVARDGKAVLVDVVDEDNVEPEVAAFQITGETKFHGLKEGLSLSDLSPGKPLFIIYRALNKSDYKGTALHIRVLRGKPKKSKPDEKKKQQQQ